MLVFPGGFWYKKTANAAAIKAFLVNRIGDLVLLSNFLIFYLFGTINYDEVFVKVSEINSYKSLSFFGTKINYLDLICLLLFIGAMGNPQILLHTWLPDAMEGPTPVSALIHAATMVTAGVLVVRCSPIFEYSALALNVVAIIGMSTAFLLPQLRVQE